MKTWAIVLSSFCVVMVASCGGARPETVVPPLTTVVTKTEQQAITPAKAIERLKAGNRRFMTGHSRTYDYMAQAEKAAKGQYPFATILSCIDSRTTPETVFDLSMGDAFVARIAGNIATSEQIGSMEFACKVAGSKVIVVMGHNECGAVKGACDGVKLDNVTLVMANIDPAVVATTTTGDRTSDNENFVQMVAVENVRLNIALIRARSPILSTMESKGELKIVGAMMDLASGEVTWLPGK